MRWNPKIRQISTLMLAGSLVCIPALRSARSSSPAEDQQTQSPKQNMKNAGQETKNAARDAGRATKEGTKKAYHATKNGTKKAYGRTKNAVKGAKRGAQQPQ